MVYVMCHGPRCAFARPRRVLATPRPQASRPSTRPPILRPSISDPNILRVTTQNFNATVLDQSHNVQVTLEYTPFPSQDSGLFGPNLWKVLAPPSNYLSIFKLFGPNPWNKSCEGKYCDGNWVYKAGIHVCFFARVRCERIQMYNQKVHVRAGVHL